MALPVLEKTYTFSVNEAYGGVSAAADHTAMLFAIKDRLTSYLSNPWVVHSSSNGVGGSAGLGDYWLSTADLDWSNGGVRSWIVLTMPNGGQVLLDCNGTSGPTERLLGVYYSAGGLYDASGASTSVLPTATDENVIFTNGAWFAGQTIAQNYKLHFIHSNDGENSMVIGFHSGNNRFFMGSLKVQDPVAGWDYPHVFHMLTDANADHMTYTRMRAQQLWYTRTTAAGINFVGGLTCEGFLSDAIGQETVAVNVFSGDWPMAPMGFASTTLNARGRHGRIADLWYGPTALNSGDTLEENPGAPTREFAQFADIIVPWDGSVPLIA